MSKLSFRDLSLVEVRRLIAAADDGMYLILDSRESFEEKLVWWKPKSSGYTTSLLDAGIYPKEKADAAERNRGSDIAVPLRRILDNAVIEVAVPASCKTSLVGEHHEPVPATETCICGHPWDDHEGYDLHPGSTACRFQSHDQWGNNGCGCSLFQLKEKPHA